MKSGNRFTMSGFMLIIASAAMTLTFCCPELIGAERRRSVATQPDTANYLQFTCWIHESPRLVRVSAWIAAHKNDYPSPVTPPMVRHDENLRRTIDIFRYMRRETWCDPITLSTKFTREEAKQMYESASFLLEVSRFLDDLYGEDGW